MAKIVSIRFWQFEGLPQQIVLKIDDLMRQWTSVDIIEAIYLLDAELKQEEADINHTKGASQMMGELYMAVGMQRKYLRDSVRYLNEKNSGHDK